MNMRKMVSCILRPDLAPSVVIESNHYFNFSIGSFCRHATIRYVLLSVVCRLGIQLATTLQSGLPTIPSKVFPPLPLSFEVRGTKLVMDLPAIEEVTSRY